MKYRFHPFASQEADDAFSYYQALDRRLGAEFVEEFESAIARIICISNGVATVKRDGTAVSPEPFPVWNSLQAFRF